MVWGGSAVALLGAVSAKFHQSGYDRISAAHRYWFLSKLQEPLQGRDDFSEIWRTEAAAGLWFTWTLEGFCHELCVCRCLCPKHSEWEEPGELLGLGWSASQWHLGLPAWLAIWKVGSCVRWESDPFRHGLWQTEDWVAEGQVPLGGFWACAPGTGLFSDCRCKSCGWSSRMVLSQSSGSHWEGHAGRRSDECGWAAIGIPASLHPVWDFGAAIGSASCQPDWCYYKTQ